MNQRQYKLMREKLAEIEKRDGQLTPDAVVNEARNKRSVLHRCFEWDDAKAAHQYRLDQARELIVSVRYVQTDDDGIKRTSPLYIRNPEAEANEQGYRSVRELRTDRDLAHEALTAEFARAAAHLRRAFELSRALGFGTDEIADIQARVGATHTRLMQFEAATDRG